MAMRSSDFPELLDTPLRKIFFLSLENSRPEYQRWINIVETKRAFEDDLRMAEFGSIPQHTEGSTPLFEDAIEGTTKRYAPLEYVGGYIITQVLREDELHGIMGRMTEGLRESQRNLFEVQAYNILNNSTTATTTRLQGFDGLALLSTAHPNLGNPDTQANKPTTDVTLSQLAVENAVNTMTAWTNEKGFPVFHTPSLAIVDTSDQFIAAKIFKNAMRYDTANHEENWVKQGPDMNGISEFIASRYFTATNQWFLLSEKRKHDLNMFIRVHPQFETSIDFPTGNLIVKTRSRLFTSFGRWPGVYGSKGF